MKKFLPCAIIFVLPSNPFFSISLLLPFFPSHFNFLHSTNIQLRKVTVLGAAGGIGQPLSLLLKDFDDITHLSLYDIVNTPGVAADLSHIPSRAKVSRSIYNSIVLRKSNISESNFYHFQLQNTFSLISNRLLATRVLINYTLLQRVQKLLSFLPVYLVSLV